MEDLTDIELERRLAETAASVDATGAQRVGDRVRRARRFRRYAPLGLGVAAAAVVVLGLNLTGVVGSDPVDENVQEARPPSTESDSYGAVEPGTPCPGALHAGTANALKTQVPFWQSDSAQLSDAWTCGDTPVLLYGDVQISYEQGWGDIAVDKEWAAYADEDGGYIDTVLGRPAYIHPATEAGPRVGVMVVVDGTLVRLLAGKDVSVDEVIKLAESLNVPSAEN